MQVRARAGVRLGAVAAALACVLAGFGAAPASAAEGCQGWTGAQPPLADTRPGLGLALGATAVVSACDVWMSVTHDGFSVNGTVEHWTGGSTWTSMSTPGDPDHTLDAMAAVSATDVWGVGEILDQPLNYIVHWDGTRWTSFSNPTPSGSGTNGLTSVSAVSASDVWAVGESYTDATDTTDQTESPLIEHWDGSRWNLVTGASLDNDFDELTSVSAISANNVWAVGEGFIRDSSFVLIEHWDGSRWSRVTAPSPGSSSELTAVSGTSASDVWAVGDSDLASGPATLIEHWDGSKWTRVFSPDVAPGSSVTFYSVDAISAGNAWAFATTRDASGVSDPLVLHWDGRYWTQAIAPAGVVARSFGDETLDGGAGADAAGDIWLAGTDTDSPSQGAAAPLAQAQIVVNANSALGETGYVTRSVPSANLAPGTNPAVAVQPDGSSLVAWQASSGLLWTLDAAGHTANTQHQVATGTSPAIVTVSGGGYAVVFHSAGDDVLRQLGPQGSANALGNGPAVAAGTSPAIAWDGNVGFEVAYHAAGTDHLVTVNQAGGTHDTGAVIAAGASPAVTALADGGYQVVYPNASGALTGIGPDGTPRALGSGPAVAAGTSPAAAVDTRGVLEAVYQAASTGELWTVNAGTARDAGVAAAAGTSPAVAAVVSGGFEIAYQATAGRELFTLTGNGPARDAGFAMGVHDSPVMAVLPPTLTRVTVPGVTGQDDTDARLTLTAAGLAAGQVTADNSCQAAPGIVTAQSPPAGTPARLGDPVALAESTGKTAQGTPCHPVVPSLFGDDDQTARNALAAQGLVVGQVNTGSSCQVSKGDVYTQSIGANTAVSPGTVVNFTESNGLDQHNKPCNVQ